MKIDPYNHEKRYKDWKAQASINGIKDISKVNSDIIFRYVDDMEHGLNISSKSVKGLRSYIRLNTLREKMVFFSKKFKEIYDLDCITEITENQVILFFSKMRKGEILRKDGKKYQSVNYFVKVFKAFWHWWQVVNKKQGKIIEDITCDLDSRGDKGIWVKEHTLWKKTEMAVFAYFSKVNNKPSTYREIARAYVSSSYSNFQKACKELEERGYLERLENGEYRVRLEKWNLVKTGNEQIERRLPYFDSYLKKLNKRKKVA